jgi:hypothetical protein
MAGQFVALELALASSAFSNLQLQLATKRAAAVQSILLGGVDGLSDPASLHIPQD